MYYLNLKLFFVSIFFIISISYISPAIAEIKFEEVTNKAGVFYYGDTYGSYWGDFNGDDFPDLWLPNHGKKGSPRFFLNNGDGTFTNITKQIPSILINVDKHASAWADFDNDGDQDLIILSGGTGGTGQGSPNFLLRNNNGFFENIAFEFGLDYQKGRGRSPLWIDWNNDGKLDLLVGNAIRPDGESPTAIFIQGNENFEKMKEFKTLELRSVQSSDLFSNGNPKIIFLGNNNYIFDINSVSEILIPKLSKNIGRTMDFAISDFNNDLSLDVFISSRGHPNNPFKEDLFLINHGNELKYERLQGLLNSTSCLGIGDADFDNDMDVDIYMVCGIWSGLNNSIKSDKNLENILYENLGEGIFDPVPNAGGANGSNLGVGESVSVVDYDGDGFMDIFVTNGGGLVGVKKGGPNQLFRNLGNENHWIEIDLIGTSSNRDSIGARVLVTTDEKTQIREQKGGVHYRAQNHKIIHFGLGDFEEVDRIIVYWPSGIVSFQENIPADQIIKFVEPEKTIPPKKQMNVGIEPQDIICNKELELVIKPNDKGAGCVKIDSVKRLIQRGWEKPL